MRMSMRSGLLAGGVCLALAGQAMAGGPKVYDGYKVPKDSSGHPDLNGSISRQYSAAAVKMRRSARLIVVCKHDWRDHHDTCCRGGARLFGAPRSI